MAGHTSNPDFQYIEFWKNNRAVINMNGHRFVLCHALNGGVFGKGVIYRACERGQDLVIPSPKLPVLLRRLRKLKDQIDSYGRCPHCGGRCVERERRLNGNDRCVNDHVYPSSAAVPVKKEETR